MSVLINGTNGLIQAYDYQVLTTGFSYTFAAGTQTLVINPATTLAAGTITMPASPSDGMTITFSSTKQITALTLNGNTGQTVVSAVTVLPANQATTYVYRATNTSWYPISTVATNAPVTPVGGSVITTGTTVASTSGTTIDFTGFPSWVKRITIMFDNVSNSAGVIITQLGTSGGFVTSGYTGGTGYTSSGVSTVAQTTGLATTYVGAASQVYSGAYFIHNAGSNKWMLNGSAGTTDGGASYAGACLSSLGGTLTQIRLTNTAGGSFDAGSITVAYE